MQSWSVIKAIFSSSGSEIQSFGCDFISFLARDESLHFWLSSSRDFSRTFFTKLPLKLRAGFLSSFSIWLREINALTLLTLEPHVAKFHGERWNPWKITRKSILSPPCKHSDPQTNTYPSTRKPFFAPAQCVMTPRRESKVWDVCLAD